MRTLEETNRCLKLRAEDPLQSGFVQRRVGKAGTPYLLLGKPSRFASPHLLQR
jgi:hypothetical protein